MKQNRSIFVTLVKVEISSCLFNSLEAELEVEAGGSVNGVVALAGNGILQVQQFRRQVEVGLHRYDRSGPEIKLNSKDNCKLLRRNHVAESC